MKVDNYIKYTLTIILILFLFLINIRLQNIIDDNKQKANYKDIIILYELCRKKTGSQTKFILKSYGEEETFFKNYLLK